MIDGKVYLVRDDDEERVVEAPSFAEAVGIWRANLVAVCHRDGHEIPYEDPQSVTLISEEPVLRATNPAPLVEKDERPLLRR